MIKTKGREKLKLIEERRARKKGRIKREEQIKRKSVRLANIKQ